MLRVFSLLTACVCVFVVLAVAVAVRQVMAEEACPQTTHVDSSYTGVSSYTVGGSSLSPVLYNPTNQNMSVIVEYQTSDLSGGTIFDTPVKMTIPPGHVTAPYVFSRYDKYAFSEVDMYQNVNGREGALLGDSWSSCNIG